MNSVSESFETNMTTEQIQALVKMQLSDMASWNIVSHSVTGSDSSAKTYSSPRLNHYVMIPNDDSVAEAKDLIQKVMDGETLSDDSSSKSDSSSESDSSAADEE